MKRLIIFLALILLLSAVFTYSQPFGPPIYIANPSEMECRYYFAGDRIHFNPRPDNFTIDIGYTTDFNGPDQACEFWRCIYTGGTVKVDENKKLIEKNLCACSLGFYWDDVHGCMKSKESQHDITFLQLIWKWIKGIF